MLINGFEIRRDLEEEEREESIYKSKYTCYKVYLQGKVIGSAKYRLFKSQSPYWYIDEFVISKQNRDKGYGSLLLKHIIQEMWNKQKLPIHIYPTSQQIPKEKFIEWLINRGFVEQPPLPKGHIFCILSPNI